LVNGPPATLNIGIDSLVRLDDNDMAL